MLKYIALLLGGTLTALAGTGTLQNSDFASGTDITSAGGSLSQLLNTSKIWDSTNSQLLDTTIAGKQATIGAYTAPTHQFINAYSAGLFSAAQPSAADLTNGTTGTGAVMLAASPTTTGTMTVQAIAPSANSTYNVGASGNAFLNGYFNTTNTGTVNKGLAGVLTIQTTNLGTDIKLNPLSGVVDVSSAKISNLATPLVSTDAATKGYVDGIASASPLTTKGDIYGYSTTNARIPVGSDGQILTADSTQSLGVKWAAAPVSGINQLTGDVTAGPGSGSQAATIANSAVTNAKMANMNAHTYKGNNTASSSAPLDVTATQLTADLNLFSSTLQGLTPASGGGTSNFLRADGTWAAPAGVGTVTTTGSPVSGNLTKFSGATSVTNGDLSGDVTTSGTLATTIANSAVTNAKMANMAANTIKGNNTGLAAAPIDLSVTQATAMLNNFVGDSGSGGTKGLVLAPSAGDAALNKFLKADGSWSSVQSISRAVNQASHGFSVGNIVYFNGTSYAKAQANSDTTSEVLGIVSSVVDANNFYVVMGGYITGLSGLVAGTTYYLSDSSAGALTATAPTTVGYISKPVFVADSTTSGYFHNMRGVVIAAYVQPSNVSANGTGNYRTNYVAFSGSSNVATLSACSSSPCTINYQSGSWVTSVTRGALGNYTVNFAAGEFTAPPTCTCSVGVGTSTICNFNGSWPTTSSAQIYVRATTNGAAYDEAVTLTCTGPK